VKEKIAGISVLVNMVLALGKIIAGLFSGSASVFAEGLHSGMDVMSSGICYIGIRISGKTVNNKFPYGYYKFEVLSGLIITIILFLTGGWIAYSAYMDFLDPKGIEMSYLAIGVMTFSAIVNEVMARFKIHYGKKENSVSLLSDGIHSRVDVFTSIAVLAGLLVNKYWIYTDSLLALLIGIYIIKESFSLGKEVADSLLDVSAGEEVETRIRDIVNKENIGVADLKTQKKGSVITVNIKIRLPGDYSVNEATKISDDLREKIVKQIKNIQYIAVQLESHDISSNYFRSGEIFDLGRGFGWQRRGNSDNDDEQSRGKGPGGRCVCPVCGYEHNHEKGKPCSSIICPECNTKMKRKELV